MTMLFELLFQNISFYIDPLIKYDEDGYPIEDEDFEELEEEEELDTDDGFDIDNDLLSSNII